MHHNVLPAVQNQHTSQDQRCILQVLTVHTVNYLICHKYGEQNTTKNVMGNI